MSDLKPLFVTDEEARELRGLLDERRSGALGRKFVDDELPTTPPAPIQTQSVMLMEPLRANRIAKAEKLRVNTGAYTLDVVLLGFPSTSVEDFGLLVNGSESKEVRVGVNATAEEFQQATGVTGDVTLGSRMIERDDEELLLSPGRWRITWNSKEDAELLTFIDEGTNWFVRVEETLLLGTGNLVDVIQTIPTGWDTPLKAGAICETLKHGSQYYKVIAAEPRFWFRENDIEPETPY